MSPQLVIAKRDRRAGWIHMDLRDKEGIDAVVVFPTFGRNHYAGTDCWCHPQSDVDIIVHNAEN